MNRRTTNTNPYVQEVGRLPQSVPNTLFGFILCVRNPPFPLPDFIVHPDPVGLSEEKKNLNIW